MDKTLLAKKKLKNSMNSKLFPLAATFSLYFMKSQSILHSFEMIIASPDWFVYSHEELPE